MEHLLNFSMWHSTVGAEEENLKNIRNNLKSSNSSGVGGFNIEFQKFPIHFAN